MAYFGEIYNKFEGIFIKIYQIISSIGWLDLRQSWPTSKKNFLGLRMCPKTHQKKFQPIRPSNLVSDPFWIFLISLNKRKNLTRPKFEKIKILLCKHFVLNNILKFHAFWSKIVEVYLVTEFGKITLKKMKF